MEIADSDNVALSLNPESSMLEGVWYIRFKTWLCDLNPKSTGPTKKIAFGTQNLN